MICVVNKVSSGANTTRDAVGQKVSQFTSRSEYFATCKCGNFCASIYVAKLWTMVNPCLAHAGCTPNLSLPESHSNQILIIGLYNRYDILIMEISGPAICCSVKCSLLVYCVTENIIKKRALKIYTSVS